MPVIFGQHLTTKTMWIGGGLAAAAVAAVVAIRARAGASEPPATAAATEDQGYGVGGAMSIGAPTQGVADAYSSQMSNAEQQAAALANKYQQNLIDQQQRQFDFQQRQMEALSGDYLERERSALAAETHYNKTVAKTRISCPGNGAVYQTVDGQLACRQKTSGGFLGIPLGSAFRTVQGFFSGLEAAAPEIGYGAAKQAASYYTGKTFGGPAVTNPVKPSTPGINPYPQVETRKVTPTLPLPSPHNYDFA